MDADPHTTIVLKQLDGLEGLSANDLLRMHDAAVDVIEMQRLFAKTGGNVVGEVLRDAGSFVEWQHYPENDVYDPDTGSQYYYHAHPPEERGAAEHGHFHLFMRERCMPAGMAPLPRQDLPEGDNAVLSHLVAISMNAHGLPIGLFTTNRWVTGDVWYAASDVARMLDAFQMEVVRPNLAVSRWMSAMVRLFRPQIVSLLAARDQALDGHLSRRPPAEVFEDRGIEVLSVMRITVEDQLRLLTERLDGAVVGPSGASTPRLDGS